jgi:hypothetical protein
MFDNGWNNSLTKFHVSLVENRNRSNSPWYQSWCDNTCNIVLGQITLYSIIGQGPMLDVCLFAHVTYRYLKIVNVFANQVIYNYFSTHYNVYNKKFWEELIAYFPWYDTDRIENDASKNSSIACVRYRGNVSTDPLPSTDRGTFTEPSRHLATIRGYAYRHTDWWEGFLIRPLRWSQVPWYTYKVS